MSTVANSRRYFFLDGFKIIFFSGGGEPKITNLLKVKEKEDRGKSSTHTHAVTATDYTFNLTKL